jgi:hypothetical protein
MLTAPGARSQPVPLLGWTVKADANAVDVLIDNASGLAGAHPLVQADLPEDSSDFETGPFGHGLASVFWPGTTAGNLGSLSGQLGLPPPLASVAGQTNDTVKAETFYPYGPEKSSYPPGSTNGDVAEMQTNANDQGVTATSALSDLSLSGLLEVSGVKGASSATAANSAEAVSVGSFSALSLLGGLITIGATSSTATARSDGTSPSGTAVTHIGAITVAGQPVTVGNDGLVIGPASSNLLGPLIAPATSAVQTVISTLGLTVTALPQAVTSNGPAESVTSAGLQLKLALPNSETTSLDCSFLPPALAQLGVLCTLPGSLQGANITITIGRVTSSAIAAAPFDLTGGLPNAPGPTITGPLSDGSIVPSGVAPIGDSASPVPTPDGASLARSPDISRPSESPLAAATRLSPISLSTPVKSGLVAFVFLLATLIGAGAIWGGRRLDGLSGRDYCDLEETHT